LPNPVSSVFRAPSAVTVQTILLYVCSFAAALLVGAVFIVMASPDVLATYSYFFSSPTIAIGATLERVGSVYFALLTGAIGSPQAVSESLLTATPLIIAGLGLAVSFRAGLINVGGAGQGALAALAAGVIGFALNLPFPIPLMLAAAAGIVVGAGWAALAGFLKARFGAHEVVTTIMLNYIAANIVLFLLGLPALNRPGRSDPITPAIGSGAQLPGLLGDQYRVNIGILLAILAAVAVYIALFKTPQGLELRSVGQSQTASRALGINRNRVWIGAMAASGALVGLAASVQVLGVERSVTPGTASTIGIDGLVVALLGRTSPLGCVVAGLFVGAMRAGGTQMQAMTGVPLEIVLVIEAVVVLIVATPNLAVYLFKLRKARIPAAHFKGWAA
jgi:ABC-type uncharacterized transport system permease subunit